MSEIARNNTGGESRKSSTSVRYNNRVYGLIQNVKEDLELYGLEPEQVSIDVETQTLEDSLEIEYSIETLEWYESEEEFGLGKEPVSFNNSYSIVSETELPEDEILYALRDNFHSSAISANGEVIKEALSPDHDAF